ncbi:MAG TPA: histidine kinase, partial [Bacteroidales bacterium]|nr:histidine kinase [Bacteroidales bacterium]
RYALKQDAMQLTSLQNELENVQLYLNIERVRFGDRLQTCFEEVEETMLNLEVPVMILQPLFENSIKHGVQNTPGNVKIVFTAEENSDNSVTYSVSNTYDSNLARFKAEGVGLSNIRNRLRLIYGNGKLLTINAGQTTFTASLTFPKKIFRE